MEVLYALARCLDFDRNSPNSHDNIKGIPMEAIIGKAWIKLPDCGRGLDNGNFCDVSHDIDVCQIDNMFKTSGKEGR